MTEETNRAPTIAAAATLAVAVACWLVAVRRMSGMDMGAATDRGSLAFFIGTWVSMMAAMMLPGALPAILRRTEESARVHDGLLFATSYLAVWTVVGLAAYALFAPHSTRIAGALTIAAGVYELTPLKRACRRRCRERTRSGLGFGLACVGSSAGLMALLAAVGLMSVPWMAFVAALVVGQKLLAPRPQLDVALAFAIVALGILILLAPGSVPGLTPSM